MHIGQSSGGGGCLNSSISCNSAACLSRSSCSSCYSANRFSHSSLCFDRCFFLHEYALQYVADLHLLQIFGLLPFLPQLAQVDTSLVSDNLLSVKVILSSILMQL